MILGYIEDGPNLVTLTMNGSGKGEPQWWLNLQANPESRVQPTDGIPEVVDHAVSGSERARRWDRWRSTDKNLDGYARRRPASTAGVVLEPGNGSAQLGAGHHGLTNPADGEDESPDRT